MLDACRPPTPPRATRLAAPLLATLLAMATAAPASATEFPAGNDGYHSYTEVTAEVAAVAAAHPDIVAALLDRQEPPGPRALGGQDLATTSATDETEPEVMFDGGASRRRAHVHGDDAPDLALARGRLRERHADHERSSTPARSGSSSWSTRTAPSSTSRAAASTSGARTASRRRARSYIGTDLNRNYGYRWGGGGEPAPTRRRSPTAGRRRSRRPRRARCATSWPAASSTAGSRSASAITFHEFGRLVMWPYGYT